VPTYQYACTECGEQLEKVQKFTDEPLTVCPACDGRLRKVFSPVGIVFKGSGFYRTDSRAGNGAKDGQKDGKTSTSEPAAAGSGSKTEGSGGTSGKSDKGDKKPAASSSSSKDSSSGSASTSSGSAGEKVA
jgi:putative FmdB family regulatory protein